MHNFVKKSFSIIINTCKGLQFSLFVIAFLTMVDFILQLMGIKLPDMLQGFFDFIYNVQSTFYKPNLEALPVDFTLALAAFVMLLVAGALVYLVTFLDESEKIYDRVHAKSCEKFEQKFNAELKNTIVKLESQVANFVLFYNVSIEQTGKISQIISKNNPQSIAIKEKELTEGLKNTLTKSFNIVFRSVNNSYLLFFDDIHESKKVFEVIFKFIAESEEILKKDFLKINYKIVSIIASQADNQELYLPKINKLLNIALPNKITTIGEFKEKYEKLPENSYKITALGEYIFNDEVIDVYSLEP